VKHARAPSIARSEHQSGITAALHSHRTPATGALIFLFLRGAKAMKYFWPALIAFYLTFGSHDAIGLVTLSVEPPAPTTSDSVLIRIRGQTGGAGPQIVSVTGPQNGQIVIVVDALCTDPGMLADLSANLGQLPVGNYVVTLVDQGCFGVPGPLGFSVTPASIPTLSNQALVLMVLLIFGLAAHFLARTDRM
jgi:hypothetical protein